MGATRCSSCRPPRRTGRGQLLPAHNENPAWLAEHTGYHPSVRRAVLVLLFLVAPDAARAARGRLVFSVAAGGGYASDVFVGAGLGSDGLFQITPAARLDLSLSPRLKLGASTDLSYGYYVSSQFTSLFESASASARWLGGEAWEASLEAAGEHGSYSKGLPIDPGLVTSPSVSSTVAGRISPLLRLRAGGFEWRAAGVAGARSSTSAGADIPETDLAALAGFARPLSERVSVAVTYKLAHDQSDRTDFTLTSHALFGLLSWHLERLALGAQVQLQTSALGTGVQEDLLRVTATASYPVSNALDAEAVYTFTADRTDDPARPSATLHLAYLGFRWKFGEVSW